MKRKECGEVETETAVHKLSKGELYKPPTNEELHQLKEAETLFQSSLFRLQVTELLKEVHHKNSRQLQIDDYITRLCSLLQALPPGDKHKLTDADWLTHWDIQLPLTAGQHNAVKGSFQFLPPKSVKVIGSYQQGTSLKPHSHVDIWLEIPKENLEPKDFLNFRYLTKRALYLATVAHHLRKTKDIDNLSFTYFHGNKMKPILVVTPTGKVGHHVKVHLHTGLEEGSLKRSRFDIRKNNIRSNWFYGDKHQTGESGEPATPVYNTSILTDLCIKDHDSFVRQAIDGAQSVADGIALLKVWLRQRELLEAGFSGFIMTMYVVYLLQKHRVSAVMSSYQIMRSTLLHFVKEDWTRHGISLLTTPGGDVPSMSDFHAAFPVVFVDFTGLVNLCASIRSDVFMQARFEASQALTILDERGVDSFKLLFITPVPFTQQFDHYLHITKTDVLRDCVHKLDLTKTLMDNGGDHVTTCIPSMLQLIQKSLDARVTQVTVQSLVSAEWPVSQEPPNSGQQIVIGLRLDLDQANRVLTKGPPADNAEADDFRKFWGNKSELRRFQDGNICEAVVWSTSDMAASRRVIVGQMIKHILNRHAGIPFNCMRYTADVLDMLLSLYHTTRCPYGTGEEESAMVLSAFDSLAKLLRNLTDLPLTFVTIQGTSPVFRHAEVFPSLPALQSTNQHSSQQQLPSIDRPCRTYTASQKVICTLEGSGKWPDDLDAIQRLKAAMLIQVATSLTNEHQLVTQVLPSSVLVLKDGYVFDLHLSYAREIVLLKEVHTPEGQVQIRETGASLDLQVDTVLLPRLSTALHGIHQGNSTFSSVVRLAKRWLSSQLLWHYVSEEAIELLVAHLYVSPLPLTPPGSTVGGFLRFLRLLSTHDWASSPVIVNFNQELKHDEITEIRQNFAKHRKSLPAMFIVSTYSHEQSVWTRHGPDVVILQRLVTLAGQSLRILEGQLLGDTISPDFKLVFRPPLDAYDVLIHLRLKHVPRHCQAVDPSATVNHPYFQDGHREKETRCLPAVSFDPVQCYLQELKASFDDVALFFHDIFGGLVIGVLWKPHIHEAQAFKVSNLYQRMVRTTSSDVQLVANFDAYLEDFRIMGQGLVDSIESKIKISIKPGDQ